MHLAPKRAPVCRGNELNILRDDEVAEWCAKREITLDLERRVLTYDSYPQGIHDKPYIDLPEARGTVMRLADALVAEDELSLYYGSLLWVRESVIFQSEDERTAIKLVTQFVSGYGRRASLYDGTGYLFDPTERLDQAALLAAVILCQWDAYLVPCHGQYAVFLCHDGYAEISGPSPETVSKYMEEVGGNWQLPPS
jgi:hypothetical protein